MISRTRPIASLVFLLVTAGILAPRLVPDAAAAPILKSVRPVGGQRGTTFTLTLVGQELAPGSELITTLPATVSRLSADRSLKKPETELPFLIQLKADAPVGLYPLRVKGPDGISNLVLFSVGDFPEIEINKEIEPEQREPIVRKMTPPVVVNSTLKSTEQDVFRFTAAAGQRLVFEVEARRLGSALDPVIRIVDQSGHEVAVNDDTPGLGLDPRVMVTFPRAGEYRVVVHDSRFSEQDQNFYRLKVGNYLFAGGIFPLGWKRGESVDVALFGGNLPRPLSVRPSLALPASTRVAPIAVPGTGKQGSLPIPFVVSDSREILEPAAGGSAVELPPDTIMNGRISQPGEKDLYRVRVQPGQRWLFEVQAASLGTTRLGAYLELRDEKGKTLASAVDGSSLIVQEEFSFTPPEKGVDPRLLFRVPDGVTELILSLEDINERGGPEYGYRLRATPKYEEFSLDLSTPFVNIPSGGSAAVSVRVNRDTYQGPVRLRVGKTVEGLEIGGGNIPARVRDGLLVFTLAPGVQPVTIDLEVWGEGTSSSGEPILRRAYSPGMITPVRGGRRLVGGAEIATQKPHTAAWLGMDLVAGVGRPAPVSFHLPVRELKLVHGMKHEFEVRLDRNVPITSPIRIEGLRPGGIDVAIKGMNLEAKSNSVPVQMTANFNARVGRFDMALTARFDLGGRQMVVTSPVITVDLVRAFALGLPGSELIVQSGSSAVLEGEVHRQAPFSEAVRLKVEDLPLHVSCEPLEVAAGESAFRLKFQAEGSVEPGEYDVRLVASAHMEGRKDDKDYTIPDTKLRLKIVRVSGTTTGPNARVIRLEAPGSVVSSVR